jgi:ATP-dependent HslUV protease subunit HslV
VIRPRRTKALLAFAGRVFSFAACALSGRDSVGVGHILRRMSEEQPLIASTRIRSTTVLCVRRNGKVVLGADGQVSMGNTIVKGSASKVRTLARGKILAGFAGSAADGLTLCDLLEAKLEAVGGNFTRACVELAKDWRLDRRYRRLEALLIVADKERSLLLSGTGDVIEAEDGVLAIGSGGNYALSAARALLRYSELDARALVEGALTIAAEICVFTNSKTTILELEGQP